MITTSNLLQMKQDQEKITMVTAYDYPSAKTVEKAAVDMILVGDSLGMVVLGYDSTVQVTVDDMIHHAKAVRRGAPNTFTVVDMPFMSYHISMEASLSHAQKLFQESNAQALKVEGADDAVTELIKRLTYAGIPVVGHIGLTPQTVNVLGGYKVQGKDRETGERLLKEAQDLAASGACAVVLECVPMELAKIISDSISIPTIGIGAGVDCDGQVLVYHDILQYGVSRLPKFVKPFADFNEIGVQALEQYIREVKNQAFPTEDYSFLIQDQALLPTKQSEE
ncbi:3-methyl-2-oxobutanoate hydroxymethyltransferase [Ornithinibacillus gellani]|uniref:3-methyl-2-oxobutanoate hydroxymethyltransferase n=1 Tax=Ornithinibacillus gellani TaxID=2293253 RepID=UPI000F48F41D|nr:3-methyl-2-oxobutanoate hydroxymethyltransferase [Ornithinibacillus gellani]TQS74394.1 3-methyl-2-oxobutanoate hydroxymethyltransferase [Ornithinibacillus gellani]